MKALDNIQLKKCIVLNIFSAIVITHIFLPLPNFIIFVTQWRIKRVEMSIFNMLFSIIIIIIISNRYYIKQHNKGSYVYNRSINLDCLTQNFGRKQYASCSFIFQRLHLVFVNAFYNFQSRQRVRNYENLKIYSGEFLSSFFANI